MLTKSRCPHTGVVNFFTAAEPLLAVGSVSTSSTSAHCTWHCYLDAPTSGIAPDIEMAEARPAKNVRLLAIIGERRFERGKDLVAV